MEEEEGRLKALLDQTSDYDERKKIRAELRAVRMKKLDSLNDTAATESNERAARRAERARARKAEPMNGDASAAEKDSSSSGIVITDQILAEIHDEETLQKLLNEIPTSQYEDRRRIRARIREVKRSKTEGDPPSRSEYSRQTKEVSMTSEETSDVTVKTTVETNGIETNDIEMNHTGTADGGDVDFRVTIEQSKDVEIEQPNEPVLDLPSEVVANQSEDIPDEEEDKATLEQAYKTEQQDHKSVGKEMEPEQEEPTQDEDAQEVVQENEIEEENEDEEVVENGEGLPADDGPTEIHITLKVDETEEVNAEPAMDETIEQATEESPTFEQDNEISLEIRVDEEKITDIQVKEEEEEIEEEPESVSPKPQETSNTTDDSKLEQEEEEELTDGQKSYQKDSSRDAKVAPKNVKQGGWSTQEEKKAKKPGRINTLDFRGNLKKSGRIGPGLVNLESRNTSSGAQVDFRAGLKQTGKNPSTIKSPATTGHLSRSAQDPKGKVDSRVSSKKGESASDEGSAGVKKDLPEKARTSNKPPKEIPPKPSPKVGEEENAPVEESPVPTQTEVVSENSVATPKVAEKQTRDAKNSNENKFSHKFSNAQTKASPAPPKKAKEFKTGDRSQKRVDSERPTDNGVNDVTVKLNDVSLAQKEVSPAVKIEVTEYEEDEGSTQTEVREVNTAKTDGDEVEETKEVTKVSKTDTPGGEVTTQTTTTTTTTTRKGFVDPELQKRMASRQRERVAAKREQASSAKNKRMAFMQKLEANSPASQAPTNVKRSNSNVDKLLAWCRFKTRDYEGIKLSNFSSSWADGLAFCALMHIYLPDKIPYEELRVGNDKRRNFEVAFSVAAEDGIAELLEVEDMMAVKNPEPKSVMTYVSSIYKHFNPS